MYEYTPLGLEEARGSGELNMVVSDCWDYSSSPICHIVPHSHTRWTPTQALLCVSLRARANPGHSHKTAQQSFRGSPEIWGMGPQIRVWGNYGTTTMPPSVYVSNPHAIPQTQALERKNVRSSERSFFTQQHEQQLSRYATQYRLANVVMATYRNP